MIFKLKEHINLLDLQMVERVSLLKLSGVYQISENLNEVDKLESLNPRKIQIDLLVYVQCEPKNEPLLV